MNAPKLKINLINRIIEIDDIALLKSLESLFSTSDKNISKFLELANEKMQQENETEDFTAYIKEWVKNM
ncbi:MAG: hypothetical protein Q7J19_00875 [Lutibacter sp.]|nr:hypothetical protein [Lutibacter sp.]